MTKYIHNQHEIRNKFREMLTENIKLSEDHAIDLEIGIFNSTIDYANSLNIQLSWNSTLFVDTYLNNARSIYSNLKSDSYIGNKDFLNRLISNEFSPHSLAYMSAQEIFPDRWSEILDKQKEKLKAAYEVKQVSMTDAIKCGKCKNNKVSYYELQIRSGDENMTQFFNCIVCGHKWKS